MFGLCLRWLEVWAAGGGEYAWELAGEILAAGGKRGETLAARLRGYGIVVGGRVALAEGEDGGGCGLEVGWFFDIAGQAGVG